MNGPQQYGRFIDRVEPFEHDVVERARPAAMSSKWPSGLKVTAVAPGSLRANVRHEFRLRRGRECQQRYTAREEIEKRGAMTLEDHGDSTAGIGLVFPFAQA